MHELQFCLIFSELTLLVKVFAIWSFWFAPGLVINATWSLFCSTIPEAKLPGAAFVTGN